MPHLQEKKPHRLRAFRSLAGDLVEVFVVGSIVSLTMLFFATVGLGSIKLAWVCFQWAWSW